MKKSLKMKKLMKNFCTRHGYPEGSVKFLYDCVEVKDDDTPESLKIGDNDLIETMIHQRGGC